MTAELLLIIIGTAFMIALLSGHPLAFSLGGLSVIFASYVWGDVGATAIFNRTINTVSTNITYVAIPLFIFMGAVLERSGSADRLFDSLFVLFGKIRGGLGISTVVICSLLGAATGIIGASISLMTMLALPTMMKNNYNERLATGTVMSAGSLGTIIPPSIILIIYGGLANISIGRLFAGGIGAGLLLATLYIAYIGVRALIKPSDAPAISADVSAGYSNVEKVKLALLSVIPTLALIFLVLGSIILGAASPTEAAALGSLGAVLLAFIYKRLNLQMIVESCYATMKTTAMIMWIILTASMFTSVFMRVGGDKIIENLLLGMAFAPWVVMAAMLLTILVMGMFIDSYGVLLIGVPLFTPIATTMGFDPFWFGIIFAITIQASYITPPFAYAAFYVKGCSEKYIPIGELYKAAFPFLVMQIIAIIVLYFYPEIITWFVALV